MTTNLRPRSTNWDGIQINDFAQPNNLTANRVCIDQLSPYTVQVRSELVHSRFIKCI